MIDFLKSMRKASRDRMWLARATRPLETVVREAMAMPRPPAIKQNVEGFDIIAEVKKSSPAVGELSAAGTGELAERAIKYAHAGAIAVSVLTEPSRFGGSLEHLQSIAEKLRPLEVPVMRKDFLVDTYQVWEAAAAGAGGILLIIRMLEDYQLLEMLEAAAQAKMFVLLEAFDQQDLDRAMPFVNVHQRVLVGLNSRDLKTLEVHPTRFAELADAFPPDCLRVAESGITTAADAAELARAGYPLALIGSAFMRQQNPEQLLTDMLAAGRKATQW